MEIGNLSVQNGTNMAQEMKNISKMRLQREVLENPEMAGKLVKVESTTTYNATGDLIQAVSNDLGDA